MKKILVLLLCVLPILPLHAAERSWLIVGDSLSAAYGLAESDGWVSLLQQRLNQEKHNIRVVNAAISGDTTTGALQRLPMALQREKPDLLILEIGGNDGLRGQSLKMIRNNLEQLVQLGQDKGTRVLLLGMQIPSNYGAAYSRRFAALYGKVADKTGAALMPFFLEPIARNQKWFQADGIHPNQEAQNLLLDAVWPHLQPFLK